MDRDELSMVIDGGLKSKDQSPEELSATPSMSASSSLIIGTA
jgi:hypothetical protein